MGWNFIWEKLSCWKDIRIFNFLWEQTLLLVTKITAIKKFSLRITCETWTNGNAR